MSSSKKKILKGLEEAPKKKARPRIYVVGGGYEYIRLMFNLGCDGAKGIDDADVVLFTGGEDVYPGLYGEVALPKTHYSRLRDEKESAIFEAALERGLPMIGICRGGQFLNVKCGGKMWQHVNGHTGNHIARIEVPPFKGPNKLRRTITVTSTHHQMMIPTEEAIILATASCCFEKLGPGIERVGRHEDDPDIEVVWYDDQQCLCFQPHPEFKAAPAECVDFFEECCDNFVFPRIPNDTAKAIVKQSIVAKI